MQSTVTTKGQITLPKPVRDRLGLKPGDKVKFFMDRDGRLTVRPISQPEAVFGMLKKYYDGPPISIEQMNEALGETDDDENEV